jgi:hypothetical protein
MPKTSSPNTSPALSLKRHVANLLLDSRPLSDL